MSAETTSDNFREWLEAMHPRLSRFEDYLLPKHIVHADGTREEFLRDYNRESLSHLEQYMLDRWPTYEDFEADNDTDFIDGAVRYIGETLLRSCGGGWHYPGRPGMGTPPGPCARHDPINSRRRGTDRLQWFCSTDFRGRYFRGR